MNNILLKNLRYLHQANSTRRSISTTSVVYQPRSLIRLKKLQADYQCEDGKPIYLKGGFCDRILYSSTVVGAILGTAWVFFTIYELAKPPSWKTQ